MNAKKLLAGLLTATMTLSLAACGSGSASEQQPAPDAEGTPAPEKVVIQVAHENNPGEPVYVAAEEWQRLVAEKSGGTMEIELFPSSQLGSKSDLIDQIVIGEPIITICDGSFLAEYGAPEMAIVSAPYVFDSWDQCWKLLESDWWSEESALLEENGIHIVTANWMFGERNIMTTKPVRSFDDMKNMILRTPNTPSYMKAFELMGAAPTAMAIGDCYTSIQQGTIEGLENTFTTLYGLAFHEVAKYVTLTKHVKMPSQWICSQTWWDTLTEEQQTILVEAGNEAGLMNNDLQMNGTEDIMASLEKEGVEIIDLSDDERAKFSAAVAPLYEDPVITAGWREDLLGYIKEITK